MPLIGEDELFVDLIGEHPGVNRLGRLTDAGETVGREDEPGGIVRSVDEDDFWFDLGDHPIEGLPIRGEAAVAIGQDRHRVQCAACGGDRRRIGIVERFECDERTAAGQKREDCCRQPLCGARRVEHLVGGDVLTEITTALSGHSLEQLGESLTRGVLIETGPHRFGGGGDEFVRRLRAGSTLPEVDGSDFGGELRHLPVDGLSDRPVRVGQTC